MPRTRKPKPAPAEPLRFVVECGYSESDHQPMLQLRVEHAPVEIPPLWIDALAALHLGLTLIERTGRATLQCEQWHAMARAQAVLQQQQNPAQQTQEAS